MREKIDRLVAAVKEMSDVHPVSYVWVKGPPVRERQDFLAEVVRKLTLAHKDMGGDAYDFRPVWSPASWLTEGFRRRDVACGAGEPITTAEHYTYQWPATNLLAVFSGLDPLPHNADKVREVKINLLMMSLARERALVLVTSTCAPSEAVLTEESTEDEILQERRALTCVKSTDNVATLLSLPHIIAEFHPSVQVSPYQKRISL